MATSETNFIILTVSMFTQSVVPLPMSRYPVNLMLLIKDR